MRISIPQRLSPVHGATAALGARYSLLSGWQVPETYSTVEAELAAARAGVGLADISSQGKLYVEGAEAAQALQAAFGPAPEAPGAGAPLPGGYAYRLRPDHFFLLTAIGAEAQTQAAVQAAVAAGGWFVTVTDMTHGLAGLCLAGPRARALLGQLCGLDFSEAAFPNRTVKATSLAKTKQLILRQDRGGAPAFSLFGAQSFAAYVWSAIQTAGHAHGLTPLGLTALTALEG